MLTKAQSRRTVTIALAFDASANRDWGIDQMVRLTGFLVGAASILCSCTALMEAPPRSAMAASIVRADAALPLDAPVPPDVETNALIDADSPFRLRMNARGDGTPQVFALQYRRNGGEWTLVEAHDFPLPKRELEMDFFDLEPDAPPPGWDSGGDLALGVADLDASRALRAESGAQAGFALVQSPWPLEAFSFAVDLDLPVAGTASLVFGYQGPQDFAQLVLDAQQGLIRLERHVDGQTVLIAQAPASMAPGRRVLAEIQSEDGIFEADLGDGAVTLSAQMPDDLPAEALGVRLSPDAAVLIHKVELSGEASTPRVSLVSSPAFSHGAVTAPLLAGDAPGYAVSLHDQTPVWTAEPGATGEFVWSLVIRRFADGAALNEEGDVFEFRMIDSDGARVSLGEDPTITLNVPDGHLGGTFVETPGRIGPFLAGNGALYFIMEPAETDNLFMMVKSEDRGRTWREIDGAGRPATGDLEAVDARVEDGVIHILHQITDEVVYHAFNTADHSDRPDQWAVTDAPVAQVEAVSQMATLATGGAGEWAAVFLGDQLYYVLRSGQGAWTTPQPLDPDARAATIGPQAVSGADGSVHIAYADLDGQVWLRSLDARGRLGARVHVAEGAVTGEDDFGAILPLVYIAESDTLVIAYRLADASLWERRLSAGVLSAPARITERQVITNAVDSQQAGADIVSDGGALHALFIDRASRAIFSAHDCGSGWSEPVLRVDGIQASWVRGAVHGAGEEGAVYRYIYDAGSEGGAGMNRYGEIALTMCW